MHLLNARAFIKVIRHEGLPLTRHQFDHMLKITAERIISDLLREALDVDASEVQHRFGFAA